MRRKRLVLVGGLLFALAAAGWFSWYSTGDTALRQILTQAKFNLGNMYTEGHGDAIAQYDLALMYARGRGVPQDDAEAVKWLRRAVKQGDADEAQRLARE